jgi:c-di-GMP-binding flagellar brake protein YcgR
MTEFERREYFRIYDRLPIEYRSVAKEEAEVLEERIRYGSTQTIDKTHEMYFFRENPVIDVEEKDQIHKYLRNIERKLDYVIELFYKSQKEQSYISKYVDLSLSGAGIKFISDVVLTDAEIVELRIVLPIFPYPNIITLCSIVRHRVFQMADCVRQELGLRFDVINEADRDLLINYIFMREREHLRMSKEVKG